MLDKAPAWARHLVIVVGTAVLTTLSQVIATHDDGTGFDAKDALWGVAAALVAQLLLWLTPLTQQYGVGAGDPPAGPTD